jgi:Xaa-Pro dipeptidase
MSSPLPEASTQRRVERLLAELPVSTTAVTNVAANVRWLTGLAGEPHELYGMAPLWCVVGPTGDWRVVAPAGEAAWIEERGLIDRLVPHGTFFLSGAPSDALRAATTGGATLAEALGHALAAVDGRGRIAIDGRVSAEVARDLEPALGRDRIVLGGDAWQRARQVKDDDEVAALRRVNAVAEAALAAGLATLEEGTTERDLVGTVRLHMVEAGARPLLGSIGFGERGALVDFAPSDRPLRAGDAVRMDVGCVLDGYHADLARTAVLGDPPNWLAEAHAALVAGEDAALDALRAGVAASEIFAVAVAATRATGLPDYQRTHCGHGIGLEMYEPALIAAHVDEPIPAGATCCVETPLYLIGRAGIQIEDAVVVTATGHERLGSLPRELLSAGA